MEQHYVALDMGASNGKIVSTTALHLPIITGPEEASATGNVLLQAFGMGDIKSEEEAREIVRRSFERNVFYPQTEERWEQKYLEFLQMCDLNDIRSQECI